VVFTAGDRFDVLPAPAGAGTYGPLVCFDVEFPEAARSVALLGAALVATISANPKAWADQQRIFAQARAAENQVYVAIANCIGTAGDVAFAGRSIITDPLGNVLAETGENEAVLFADVDVDEIPRVRGAEGGYLGLRRPETYLTA
jgi:predicted amidohydrolase